MLTLLYRVNQKIRQSNCLIILIAPGWPEMPWFWDLLQFSTEIPLQLPVSTTLLKQSHNQVFHNNPQHLNLHAWCLGVDSSKNKAFLWEWQRISPHRSSTSQSGPYLRDGAEKIRWILCSLCETSLRLLYVPVPRSKQVSIHHFWNLPKWNLSAILN